MRCRLRLACCNHWRASSRCLAVLILFLGCNASLSATPFGNPPVTRFHPVLDVYPQNFDVTAGIRDDILVANDDGILVFNGERWSHLPMPNGDMVRSLSEPVRTTDSERVYVGGYDLFGYLELQETGEYRFVDLTPEFADQIPDGGFADIWDIHVGKQGVLFRGVTQAFLYDPEDPSRRLTWHRASRFGAAFEMDGRICMPFRGDSADSGLHVLDGDDWVSVPAGKEISGLIYQWLPMNDGRYLALQADGSWQAYGKDGVSQVAMPEGFPPSSKFSDGLALENGELALTSDQGRLYFLDLEAGTYRSQRISNKYISGIGRSDNGLLLVDDEAVHHVTWPARWTVLDETQGILGSLHKAVQWGTRWFLLGSSGVQEVVHGNGDVHFAHRDWTDHEAWDLLVLDEKHALLAESYHLKLLTKTVEGMDLQPLDEVASYPRALLQSPFDSRLVLVGTELGFMVVRLDEDDESVTTAKVLLRREYPDAPGINSIAEMVAGEIWLGSERGGVFRLVLSDDRTRIRELSRIGSELGVDYGSIRAGEVALLGDQLVVSTSAGIFRFDGRRFQADAFDGLDGRQTPGERLSLVQSANGQLWAFDYRQVFRRNDQGRWQEELMNVSLRSAIEDVVFPRGAQEPVVVAGNSILQFQGIEHDNMKSPGVRITQVRRLASDKASERLPLNPESPLEFVHGNVSIHFAFALPSYLARKTSLYQARLVPLEKVFSDWSPTSAFTYYRLEPGAYRFEVRARDSAGNITAAKPYEFHVSPPWYDSIEARVAWILIGLALLFLISRELVLRRLRRLRADKIQLEKMVASRTRELESANRQLQAMAHLDGLTEIANRRRLDEYLAEVWQQCKEHERPLSLLVIDVDHFKRFNDRFGHVAGDRLLQNLARKLSQGLRRSEDLVARYGGEEFLVVLPGARLDAATELAEAMREQVEVSSLGATISIGVATGMHAGTGSVTALVNAADKALYAAKNAGRNCVRVAED